MALKGDKLGAGEKEKRKAICTGKEGRERQLRWAGWQILFILDLDWVWGAGPSFSWPKNKQISARYITSVYILSCH